MDYVLLESISMNRRAVLNLFTGLATGGSR